MSNHLLHTAGRVELADQPPPVISTNTLLDYKAFIKPVTK